MAQNWLLKWLITIITIIKIHHIVHLPFILLVKAGDIYQKQSGTTSPKIHFFSSF